MKHLHFFGCSFTAGDELSDDVWFPNKHQCKTSEEYFNLRGQILSTRRLVDEYQIANIALAYPAKLQSTEYKTYNYSRNGESLRGIIFRVLQLILYDTETPATVWKDIPTIESAPIDAIFIQIPPAGREIFVDTASDSVWSVQLSRPQALEQPFKNYVLAKVVTHSLLNFAVDDFLDMIMIANLAKQKNIPLYFINFKCEFEDRLLYLELDNFSFIKKNILNEIDVIHLKEITIRAAEENRVGLGGHVDNHTHQEIADKLKEILPGILK